MADRAPKAQLTTGALAARQAPPAVPADPEPGTALWEEAQDAKSVKPSPTDALVERWFQDTFHGLPIHTDLFNRFHAAKLDLMARLSAAAKE